MIGWPSRGAALVALALLAPAMRAQSGDEQPCRADYQIQARYDEPDRRISGRELVRWTNNSRDEVPDLWFHLYWNAFANNQSTHMVEAGGELRGRPVSADEWGWQSVTSLRDGKSNEELVGRIEFVAPDDKRAADRSVMRVVLPKAVRPGESLVFHLEWEARVPRVRRRTGYKDDFLFIAQWFPKLGVYETGNGWNCHQFHASTEFFSDYGEYDVELDLPAEYEGRVGASGVESEPSSRKDGRIVTRFAAPSKSDRRTVDAFGRAPVVHDFTWTADKQFVVHKGTFHYDDWAQKYQDEVDRVALALGRGRGEMRLRDVAVTVLLQPEHADQAARHFDATCTALFFYGLWFGGYPYEHITCVDPAWGAGAAGGMEYPTLFTAGTSMFTRPEMFEPESVTVHECGHQFWYGLVGNNEFEASWLDEGFNTFAQNDALWMRHKMSWRTTRFAGLPFDGVALAREPGGGGVADVLAARTWKLPWLGAIEVVRSSGFVDWWRAQPLLTYARLRDDPRASERNGYLSDPDRDPIDTPAWLYVDRNSYRTNSYRRTATMLRTLRGLVGSDRFLRGMRNYSEHWRFRHPYAQDFFQSFQDGAGMELVWFFDQAFRSTATVDWGVSVSQSRVAEPAGWFPDASGSYARRSTENAAALAVVNAGTEGVEAAAKSTTGWMTDVLVRRRGTFVLPITVEIIWDGGAKESFTWSHEEQLRKSWWRPLEGREISAKKVISAVLDPESRYTLDLDLRDNAWYAEVDEVAPLRWSERVLSQYAALVHWFGGLGG